MCERGPLCGSPCGYHTNSPSKQAPDVPAEGKQDFENSTRDRMESCRHFEGETGQRGLLHGPRCNKGLSGMQRLEVSNDGRKTPGPGFTDFKFISLVDYH